MLDLGLPFVFSWNINAGHILTACAAIFAGGAVWQSIKYDLRSLKHNVSQLEKKQEELTQVFQQLSSVLTQVAVQDNRIQMLEKQLDEIRHGQGFIVKIKKQQEEV
jgi:hypothetical protein